MSVKYCSFKCPFEKLDRIKLQEMNLKVTQDIKQYMKVSFKNIIKTSEYTTKENTTNFKTK